jgi:hypothetical protein
MGAPLGNLEEGSSTRDFERWMKLLGTLEDMLREALDMGISLHRGLTGEPGKDSLAGTFERKG